MIGEGTVLYRPELSNILDSAVIGRDCKIHGHVWVGGKIGDRCLIQAFAFIPGWVEIGDDCFIGPHVCFTNDKRPPSYGKFWDHTTVKRGASIGAGAVILAGVTIGEEALIGAGAVVTRDVAPKSIVVGNPARVLTSPLHAVK